ncbi:MAG: 16S rRNA (cytosine(1402)-N(4))-methyltransferase RsmH [Coprobacillus sp.]|nr:16S rRNA (cytosine(1402)-N(4))-methyltransferase RsmH [Coprobacillus sp.]
MASDKDYGHLPVLVEETISLLKVKPEGIYLDLTVGRGGHASRILESLTTGYLIGVDQDEEAIKASSERLNHISKKFTLIKDNFVHVDTILKELGTTSVDGVIMDLGVSSNQFDESERGFSYREDGPLDMRMDKDNPLSAREVVNTYSQERLTQIFKEYGEEKYSSSIARNIVLEREKKPIESTLELVEIIKKSKPSKELSKPGHPAKQVFQALRIEVNDELNVLRETLEKVLPFLDSGGRLAVISFHSLEDRIVKQTFRKYAVVQGDRINGPQINRDVDYRLINNKVITPSEEEVEANPRCKSAKLRVIERK